MMRTALMLLAFVAPMALALGQAPKPKYGSWGVDYRDMDRSVRPGDDFYRFAEGRWLRDHPIPADKTGAGYNYDLPDEAEVQVRTIVEEAATRPGDAIARKIGDFYAAWMDEAGIEARGLTPLRPYLARIDAVQDKQQLVRLMAVPGYAAPVDIGIVVDEKDPTHYIAAASQARLGLPTRDYYLLDGEKYAAYRKAYRAYIVRIETIAGIADAGSKADAIIALETRLSRDQWTPEQNRDPVATYNPMTRAELAKLAPQFDWTAVLEGIGLGGQPLVDVAQPSAIAAAGKRIDDSGLDTWKAYLTFRFISDHAPYLPKALDQAHFDFYSRTLNDVPEQRARWKRGVALLDQDLGEAVGQLYVAKHWSAATEHEANELMADMRAAYRAKIGQAQWMDGPTRTEALAKLAAFDPRIGHPVRYIDYSRFTVARDDPLANALAAADFSWQLQVSRLGKPVDRGLWDMTPQTVNAYYDPTLNQVTIPAAILQPPLFDPAADPAVNYAETGATTIGHEMGHGYDDEGRQFDAQGRLRDWWTKRAASLYKIQAEQLARQFDGYQPLPGVHIKGHLTLGENLADLGGLETAFAAYRRYVARHGAPKVIDGFTGDQRFFLAYAQAWQGKRRPGALRAQLLSDPHSPDEYRVNGIVRNFTPWYQAFAVKPGDRLYLPPAQRVHVW